MRNRAFNLAVAALLGLAATCALAGADVTTDMSKGGPTFKSGDNSLTIGGVAQFRWTGDSRQQFDADANGATSTPSGFGANDGFAQQFAIQRLRLLLSGGVYKPWLKYAFEFEMGNTSGANDNKIKDAVIIVDKLGMLTVKMGQYKTPFSLQELTADSRLHFVDRAITNVKFAPSRDLGVTLNGLTHDKKFGYSVGAFNGGGEAKGQDDQGLMYVGRAWWDPLGEYQLFESANDAPEKNIFHAGLAARTGETQRGSFKPGVFENPDNESAYTLELAWRYHRLYATGEYFFMSDQQNAFTFIDPNTMVVQRAGPGPDVFSDGWHAQFGYMITPKTFEVALRYAQIDPDRGISKDRVREERIALSYYFQGHYLKLQADGGRILFGPAISDPMYPKLALRNLPIPSVPTGALGRLKGVREYTDSQYRIQMQVRF